MLDETIYKWYSPEWFTPSAFKSFDWANAFVLYLIPLVLLLFALKWLVGTKLKQKLPVALPKQEIEKHWTSYLRFIPNLLIALSLIFILVSLARPQRTNEEVEQWSEGIDIALVIDISESMQIEDFKPNRLESAKRTARDFIAGRQQDRIGLVIFSGDAYSLSPLTTDYELLYKFIDEEIDFNKIENRGTAIGSAIAVGTNRMRESEAASKVMILLSDGDNTAGNIDPITAAELAAAYDIKIYTIGIGKEGKVPFGKDFFGRPNYVENTLDETTLREIAKIGNGQFYRVSDNEALRNVFDLIDEYEKAEIKETRYKNTTDFYPIYLKWALVFFILFLFSKSTFISNILED
ncbi:Ca-activated chloride channel family protein [Roseivirga pacifica]|uniref:Ca-activated chloride channel family protein n=1 Tax=Roseivirga pacifica TaxID=1267423 RepID=A0A1I0P714_9BACT|nr:VWA domain-containing protein [Roseivirga pacifica]MCO6360281.1 VWA domain-containing protein [Roseivirga pacifica]MCO6367652.1 VWA domain-containing protein [Roseivirga pacifica]MCO6369816.1 VWA domain-containing protein [Roseivirga pacifica]MCO6375309.1 VWA domain-containing protein [Roseivirga pacifica]MCO6380567.1 VWA domain-containing protein [Roseivirga pacifica]